MGRQSALVTGFLLAGGRSRRMGQDKTKLVVAGESMLARQIRLLKTVCRSVAVIGPPSNFGDLDVPVYPDQFSGRGPLGGLYTGLLRTNTEFNLLLACDLPFMQASFLQYLCRRALRDRADVTVPEPRSSRFEPLCAVYRRRALGAVRESLASGENRVTGFFSRVPCLSIRQDELRGAGFGRRIFVNMNTPEEYQAAKRQFRAT